MARPRKKPGTHKGVCRYGCGNVAPKYDSRKGCAECVAKNKSGGYNDCRFPGCTTRSKHATSEWCAEHRKLRYIPRDIQTGLVGEGWTLDKYLLTFQAQGGTCAVCKKPPGRRRLAMDHCHVSGEARGLLCTRCNTMLGMALDDPDTLLSAVEYLRRETAPHPRPMNR